MIKRDGKNLISLLVKCDKFGWYLCYEFNGLKVSLPLRNESNNRIEPKEVDLAIKRAESILDYECPGWRECNV